MARSLLAAALTALLCAPAGAVKKSKRRARVDPLRGTVIGTITIESNEVFDGKGGRLSRFFQGLANGLHWKTREIVIRRELLFATGDPYDGNLLRETERNLRRLGFIRRAVVTAVRNGNKADVTVKTYDSWSLEVVASYKRAGGVASARAGLAEHNLAGQGKSVSGSYSRTGTAESKTFVWKNPQFFGKPFLENQVSATIQPEARSGTFTLRRPFFASIARSSMGMFANYDEADASTFTPDGVRTGAVRKTVGQAGVEYGVALATSTERVRRFTTGVTFRRANYGHHENQAPGPRPHPEQSYFLNFGAEWTELDFVKERQYEKLSRDEDFNLGFSVVPGVVWAPDGLKRALGSAESQVLPKVVVRKGFAGDEDLILLRGTYSSLYVNEATGNRTLSGDVLYYRHWLPRQTLAVHAAYDHGWRLDPSALLTLGESNGLRGYGLSQFKGDRRVLFNVEDRVFIYNELLHVIDIGAVAFWDAGHVWPARQGARIWDLKHSIGVGLRLAPSRSAANDPIRIDFARALSPNGTSSRWTVSILAGHAFGSRQ